MPVATFNPLEYTEYEPKMRIQDDYINLTDAEKIYNLVNIVKAIYGIIMENWLFLHWSIRNIGKKLNISFRILLRRIKNGILICR